MAINRWARRTLGENYRPVVTVLDEHTVVERGPYRFVRHPMYSGSALICIGNGTALATWPCFVAWTLPALALTRRIAVEERVLRNGLGERYTSYEASRARLVPGLW